MESIRRKRLWLDSSNVTIEKFPLIVAPVTNLKLKRVFETEDNP